LRSTARDPRPRWASPDPGRVPAAGAGFRGHRASPDRWWMAAAPTRAGAGEWARPDPGRRGRPVSRQSWPGLLMDRLRGSSFTNAAPPPNSSLRGVLSKISFWGDADEAGRRTEACD